MYLKSSRVLPCIIKYSGDGQPIKCARLLGRTQYMENFVRLEKETYPDNQKTFFAKENDYSHLLNWLASVEWMFHFMLWLHISSPVFFSMRNSKLPHMWLWIWFLRLGGISHGRFTLGTCERIDQWKEPSSWCSSHSKRKSW